MKDTKYTVQESEIVFIPGLVEGEIVAVMPSQFRSCPKY